MLSRCGIQGANVMRSVGFTLAKGMRLAGWPSMSVSSRSLRQYQSIDVVRFVHNTSKKNHTSLVTSDLKHSAFHKMSLNALKNECRSRGLKVSGKKAELVDRITSYNGSGSNATVVKKEKMSTISPSRKPTKSAKLRMPNVAIELEAKTPRPRIASQKMSTVVISKKSAGKMPVPNAMDKAAAEIPKLRESAQRMSTTGANMRSTISSPGKGSMSSFVNATGMSATNQTKLRGAKVMEDKLTWRDRMFLLGFGSIVVLWWGAQSSVEETG